MSDIIQKLKQNLENVVLDVRSEKIGKVIEAGDGIARISGLSDIAMQEMVQFHTSAGVVEGVALNLEEDSVGAIILGDAMAVREGDRVTHTGTLLSVEVNEEIIGRVVDALGHPIDGKGPLFKDPSKASRFPMERNAPGVTDREPVDTPLHTGIKAIDAMIPIGRGQRELIIGDRQTGKTSIALDTIINQKNDTRFPRPICIYVAIGQKDSKIARFITQLDKADAMSYTIILSASASASASYRYIAPYTATAIAEYFMHQGKDVLIVYDDLSKHAVAYRELSLLLRRPPGREAYPGDIFYLHSRLLERSAKLKKEKGGGSITSLPIIETQLGDVSAYIPTNVISITDGQIYLESELFNRGTRPAINVGLSVSRVGSAAQTKAIKKVAGKLRLELAQYRELAAFSQFASELDENAKRVLSKGEALSEILKQGEREPLPFSSEAIIIYASVNGFTTTIPVAQLQQWAKDFLGFVYTRHRAIPEAMEKSGELSKPTEELLIAALNEFNQAYVINA
jgi:F-type H+-transporting ATPase subunit alpha